ncbi:MAG: hypothetical protein HY235_19595 [Acidobacteria bacterium]|nr:hypothetical protein [Acidobacteriota bacterium]
MLLAARPYVDVMSFQFFAPPDEVRRGFERFHAVTGKPLLLADCAPASWNKLPQSEWAADYGAMLRTLREFPACIGWHVCGAYLRNRARRRGFLGEPDEGDPKFLAEVARLNRETQDWVRKKALLVE